MSFVARFLAAIAATLCFARSGLAADTWTIIQSVGDVSVITQPGATPVAAKPSSPLPSGATVTTGPTGRAVLLRGRETIVMSPSSQVTLPNGADKSMSQVKQNSGTLLFKVGKKPEAHFEVNTPYLAAVVKGTTFTVKVTSQGASVHVLEGAVEVATLDRTQAFLTRAGQISSVFARTASSIFTTGATLLNDDGDVAGGWANGSSHFELEGGPGYWDTLSQTDGNTGLRAGKQEAEPEEALTERAPKKFVAALEATNETMSAARRSTETFKPKDGSVKASSHATSQKPEESKSSGKDDGDEKAAAKDKEPLKGQAKDEANSETKSDSKPHEKSAQAPKKKDVKTLVERGTMRDPRDLANVWTVTQVSGHVTVDGGVYAVTSGSLTRTLPPGTKVETGPDGRLGIAFGTKEFVIDADSVVVLADAVSQAEPFVVSGVAMQYVPSSGKYETLAPMSTAEIEALRASGGLDGGRSAAGKLGGGIASGTDAGTDTASTPGPQVNRIRMPENKKTEEVRTKVIGGLTLGLYGLTGTLMLAFGARWIWRKYLTKKAELDVETPAEARLRTIKGK